MATNADHATGYKTLPIPSAAGPNIGTLYTPWWRCVFTETFRVSVFAIYKYAKLQSTAQSWCELLSFRFLHNE